MTSGLPKAAREIERSASVCAQEAAQQLIKLRPHTAARFDDTDPVNGWRLHFYERIKELATAVSTGRPGLFADRIGWARQAMESRNLETSDLFASIRVLGDVLKERLSPASQRTVDGYLDRAINVLTTAMSAPASQLDATVPAQRLALDYVKIVLEGSIPSAIETVVERLGDPFDLRALLLDVLLPAQVEVGRLWHANEISVAEEHLVTQTTRRIMAVLASRATHAPDNGRTAIAAAIAGNVHDVGIHAIAYLLESRGWRTIYLGADLPGEELPAAARHFGADLILLSASMPAQLGALGSAIAGVKQLSSARVVVGGQAFTHEPDLWRDTGADGYAGNAIELLDSIES